MKKQLIILGFTLCAACKHDAPVVQPVLGPDAAKVISGTYTVNKFLTYDSARTFPINGKTISLQIDRVAPDTVRVRVQAAANGFYSPARDTTYNKVYVLTKPQGYYLTLETNTTEPHNQLGSELVFAPPFPPDKSPNWASYIFAPPSYTSGTSELPKYVARVSIEFTKTN
ncbi:hypothetical protein [Spirosoma utsteinense]|uniref:DUF4384 domain-containing protein n=1 Tax=Spirosoma utsteinense TaxID=2585773 RepID=A0ABR6WAS5_9BACT|nr:hypothetical protein [Spirosoma utsteinense]MBC3787877.1 hypothetical protein [Spirosoma utsteinense]MBC3793666.1 hypothetical protein [Spirosoma utsteinense]